MVDQFEPDERRSASKTLILPSVPWGSKPPTDPNHYVAPESPPTDQQVTDRQLARDIADRAIAEIPEDLRQQAYDAYQASQQAGRALNRAHAELAQLSGPAPAGLSVDELGARHVRRGAMVTYIEDLRRQQEAANQACAAILDDLHFQTEHYTGRPILDDVRRTIREMREESARLAAAADHHQIALGNAISAINVYVPTTAPAPVQAVVEPPALPKRKRLFS
jgi:hypothetical protein